MSAVWTVCEISGSSWAWVRLLQNWLKIAEDRYVLCFSYANAIKHLRKWVIWNICIILTLIVCTLIISDGAQDEILTRSLQVRRNWTVMYSDHMTQMLDAWLSVLTVFAAYFCCFLKCELNLSWWESWKECWRVYICCVLNCRSIIVWD